METLLDVASCGRTCSPFSPQEGDEEERLECIQSAAKVVRALGH